MSTYGGSTEIPLLDSVIAIAVIPGSGVSTALSPEDREDISLLFLKVRELPAVCIVYLFVHFFSTAACVSFAVRVLAV